MAQAYWARLINTIFNLIYLNILKLKVCFLVRIYKTRNASQACVFGVLKLKSKSNLMK